MTYTGLDYRFSSRKAITTTVEIRQSLALVAEENRSLRRCHVVLKEWKLNSLDEGKSDA